MLFLPEFCSKKIANITCFLWNCWGFWRRCFKHAGGEGNMGLQHGNDTWDGPLHQQFNVLIWDDYVVNSRRRLPSSAFVLPRNIIQSKVAKGLLALRHCDPRGPSGLSLIPRFGFFVWSEVAKTKLLMVWDKDIKLCHFFLPQQLKIS